MTNVLVVKGNNRPDGISTAMYETFVTEAAKYEQLNISTFDVFEANMPHMGQDLFNAYQKLKTGEALTAIESASLEAVRKSREALSAAEIVVFAFPLWNLTIPTALQAFIDYTYDTGYSFKFNEKGQQIGLMADKKYILLSARGGFYSSEERAPLEMAATYMDNIIGGVYWMEKVNEVIIEGHDADPKSRQAIIAEGLEQVKRTVEQLAELTAH